MEKAYGQLGNHGLCHDLQLNPHQFCAVAHLTQNHPETTVIIGHLGSPTLKDLQENGDQYWEGLKALADHERTYIKISMLSYIDQNWDRNPLVKETVQKVIEVFGKERCFFASNFPVEIKNWLESPTLA